MAYEAVVLRNRLLGESKCLTAFLWFLLTLSLSDFVTAQGKHRTLHYIEIGVVILRYIHSFFTSWVFVFLYRPKLRLEKLGTNCFRFSYEESYIPLTESVQSYLEKVEG